MFDLPFDFLRAFQSSFQDVHISSGFPNIDATDVAIAIPILTLLAYVGPYLRDKYSIKANGVTGPFLARFSNVWLGQVAVGGNRSLAVHDLHKKFGTFVRIAPNHVSINDPSALPIVYSQGGTLKSDFYDAFVALRPTLFNTRSREDHARKRRNISHAFSMKRILEVEPITRSHACELIERLDQLCSAAAKGLSGTEGKGGWYGEDGRLWFDCIPWYHYMAFDTTGDIVVGMPFGMVASGSDYVPMVKYLRVALSEHKYARDCVDHVHAIQALNDRGNFSAALGVFPTFWRPILNLIPWFAAGKRAHMDFLRMSVLAVSKRLLVSEDASDMFSELQGGLGVDRQAIGVEELAAEANFLFIAGSETIANSLGAITFYLAKHPIFQSKLDKELDNALGSSDEVVPSFDAVKNLPYLTAVAHETLRLFAPSGMGLPRVVQKGGLTVLGKLFPHGTILSVPTYSIHRNKQVWGEDAEEFNPDRWLGGNQSERLKAFNAFSAGPRACIGQNLAIMEVLTIAAAIFHRYEFVLEEPQKDVEVIEGFLRKPKEIRVGMKRRDI